MDDDQRMLESLTQLGQSSGIPTHPDQAVIETFPNKHPQHPYVILFETEEFTSLCEKTRQPDYGSIQIEYIPGDRILESKSLKLFLASYRNVPMFYEHLVNDIADRLDQALSARHLRVAASMNPRGGIALTATTIRGEAKTDFLG